MCPSPWTKKTWHVSAKSFSVSLIWIRQNRFCILRSSLKWLRTVSWNHVIPYHAFVYGFSCLICALPRQHQWWIGEYSTLGSGSPGTKEHKDRSSKGALPFTVLLSGVNEQVPRHELRDVVVAMSRASKRPFRHDDDDDNDDDGNGDGDIHRHQSSSPSPSPTSSSLSIINHLPSRWLVHEDWCWLMITDVDW